MKICVEGGIKIPKKKKIRVLIFKRKRTMKNRVRIVAVTQVILLLLVSFVFVRTTSSLTWNIEIIDPKIPGDVSIAVDDNNNPHIAYVEHEISGDRDLKYAVKNGMGWSFEIVESEGLSYFNSHIAVDSNGNPHISYDKSNILKYATKSGGTWVNETISSKAGTSSITISASDVPHVSYFWYNLTSDTRELKYAVKNGIVWNIETVEPYIDKLSIGDTGCTMKLDSNGDPHISYVANFTIKYATKSGGSWSIETLGSEASNDYTSIALDASDIPHIGYWNESNWDLKYAVKVGASWTIETVESLGNHGEISLAIDSSGNTRIGYTDRANYFVKYAVRNGSLWVIDIVDGGSSSSMALDANDTPHFSYSASILKYATWIPDLEVTIDDIVFNPQSPVSNGTPVLINATIHNIGNAVANNVIVRFYDGDPGLPLGSGPGVPINGDQIITLIAAGDFGFAEVQWDATPSGNHTIYVVADPSNSIFEYNEGNNIANKMISVVKLPEPPAPELFIEVVDDSGVPDGKGSNILLSWIPKPSSMITHYLIYRSENQTDFDFSTPWVDTNNMLANGVDPVDKLVNPGRLSWNHTGAADPNDDINYSQQWYYCIRAVNTLGETSYTSRTVGKWTKEFTPEGVSTFSLPLEPLETMNKTADYYLVDMNANYIKWMDPTTRTWNKHGDGGVNDTQLEVGKGYEVKFAFPVRYTFSGMPGSMVKYKTNSTVGFYGIEAQSLFASVDPITEDVTLNWSKPTSVTFGEDQYYVYNSTTRDGFYGIKGVDYKLLAKLPIGTETVVHPQAARAGTQLYYMVIPVNKSNVEGASTYTIGIWTEDYLSGYDTLGIPLRQSFIETVDWYCDNIPDTVGMNYFVNSQQRWSWHSKIMPKDAFDPVMIMAEGYQISTSNTTKFTFIGR
jgi:hypothetical protein